MSHSGRPMLLFLRAILPWICVAQIVYDPHTNSLLCSRTGGSFCVGASLETTIMMSCVSDTVAEVRACDVELSLLIPHAYEEAAVCYETSPTAGDAVCAFNGTGYNLSGMTVDVPDSILCPCAHPSPDTDHSCLLHTKDLNSGMTVTPERSTAPRDRHYGQATSGCIDPWRGISSSSTVPAGVLLIPTMASLADASLVTSPTSSTLSDSPTTSLAVSSEIVPGYGAGTESSATVLASTGKCSQASVKTSSGLSLIRTQIPATETSSVAANMATAVSSTTTSKVTASRPSHSGSPSKMWEMLHPIWHMTMIGLTVVAGFFCLF